MVLEEYEDFYLYGTYYHVSSLDMFSIAQLRFIPGDVENNLKKITDAVVRAKQESKRIIIFPELALSGYFCLDKTFDCDFLGDQEKALHVIAKHTEGIMAIVGFMRWDKGGEPRAGHRPQVYNSCAIIADGMIQGFQDKVLLPDFDVFDESRYFVSGKELKIFEYGGIKLGIHICEDMWFSGYDRNPCRELESKGADVLVNLSASPFDYQKEEEREITVRKLTTRLPLVYCNLFGAYDGFEGEVLFDGRSFIYQNDSFFYAPGFKEGIFCLTDLTVGSVSEVERIFEGLIVGIKSYFERTNNQRAIIGLSGGVDSALVAVLAKEALGESNVLCVSMPTQYSSLGTREDARKIATHLNISFKEISIQKQFNEMLSLLQSDREYAALPANVAEENMQSRLRMVVLLAMSNKFGGLVLNTGNKTELALGYCTVYGDMAGALSVLGDVNKKQVYELCRFYNEKKKTEVIPDSILSRPPSAELAFNQTDAAGMGDEPQKIAQLVDDLISGVSVDEAHARHSNFSLTLVSSLEKKLHLNEWKRRQAAPAIRVSPKAFGHGRRFTLG